MHHVGSIAECCCASAAVTQGTLSMCQLWWCWTSGVSSNLPSKGCLVYYNTTTSKGCLVYYKQTQQSMKGQKKVWSLTLNSRSVSGERYPFTDTCHPLETHPDASQRHILWETMGQFLLLRNAAIRDLIQSEGELNPKEMQITNWLLN